jgi:hypothetical protein
VKTQPFTATHGVPESFLSKFGQKVTGILCGLDRVRFRGTLRLLFQPAAMERYLNSCGVLIKEFKNFAESITAKLKAAAYRAAALAGRPMQYLADSQLSKEDYARQIALGNGLGEGLIAVFSALEPCYSYSVRGDRASKQIHLVIEPRRCTHFYHSFMHPDFGLMHVRVQSWFPFTVEICLNGREWLARQMDRAGIGYQQSGNCFVQLQDPLAAQALLDQPLHTDWPKALDQLLTRAHPLHTGDLRSSGAGLLLERRANRVCHRLALRGRQKLVGSLSAISSSRDPQLCQPRRAALSWSTPTSPLSGSDYQHPQAANRRNAYSPQRQRQLAQNVR